MPQSVCFGCQQPFDNRGRLFGHLQQNPSHRQGRRRSESEVPKAPLRLQTRMQAKISEFAPVIVEEASGHIPLASKEQHSSGKLPWLCVAAEQDVYLREIVPSKCHSSETLKVCQYHLENRTRAQLEQLQVCVNCNRKRHDPRRTDRPCVFHLDRRVAKGKRNRRARTCCTSQFRGCQTLPEHVYGPVVYDDFKMSPGRSATFHDVPYRPKRFAVVVDCEMVAVTGGSSELAQLCVVDLTTAEVLINTLVQPNGRVVDWRTKYSGITPDRMALAVRDGQALQGWQAAQTELWNYVDGDTVLVGHALQHDLRALHLIHSRVVDTSILTRLAVDLACTRRWSLKVLCAELAGFVIQNHGAKGHDCLEDTLATREVFLHCVLQPEALQRWADQKRVEEQAKDLARDMVRSLRVGKAAGPNAHRRVQEDADDGDEGDYNDAEVLHWSDMAEDLGWPHPDTGHDPWSD